MPRNTAQREAIRRAFLRNSRPMSPREVLREARKHARGLGIATVYRAVQALRREGWLVPVELPGDRVTYYERARAHHHHFVCRLCERLLEIDCSLPNLERFLPDGYALEDHQFLLYGVCADCGAAAAKPDRNAKRASGRKPGRRR